MDFNKKRHYFAGHLYDATIDLIKFNNPFDEKFTPIFDAIQDKSDYLPLFSAFSICYEIIDTFRNRAHDNSRTSCTEAMQINNFYDAKIESIDACRNLVSDKIKANNLI